MIKAETLIMPGNHKIVLDIETQNTFQEIGKHDPTKLRISVVGVYFYDSDSYECFFEKDLPRLWKRLEYSDLIIGYNIRGFDLPVMNNYYPGDLLRLPNFDIMEEIGKISGFRIKLDDVAKETLGQQKTGNGLAAIEYFKSGQLQKLCDYCLQDVKLTKEIYDFICKEGRVKYKDWSGNIKEAKIDLSQTDSLDFKPKAINLTMPL